ncbi:MAG: hypothetical protein U0Q18_20380 [Bryobacteraceae bacterium]
MTPPLTTDATMQPSTPARQIRIGPVDPFESAGEISSIWKDAWRPPCLDYQPEYVRFQFGFSTRLAPVAIAAWRNGPAGAFVAAAGRSTHIGDLYLSSWLALRPGTTPSVAVALIRTAARRLERTGVPVLVLAPTGSAAEYLLKAIDAMGLQRQALGEYRVHSGVPKTLPPGFQVDRMAPEDWGRMADRLRDDSLLTLRFDAANLRHFAGDPWGRQFLCAHRGGVVAAVAMASWNRMAGAKGIARIPALHYVRAAAGSPEALTALMAAVQDTSAVEVTVPNVVNLKPEFIKAAGLRPTGAVYSAFLFPNGCSLPLLRGTEFEMN